MKLVKIYGLVNPENNNVFYVGATKHDLEKRLKEHLTFKPEAGFGIATQRWDFIKKIEGRGSTPTIVLLEEIPFDKADYFEQYHYNVQIQKGYTLLQDPTKFRYFTTYSNLRQRTTTEDVPVVMRTKESLYNKIKEYKEKNNFSTMASAIKSILTQFFKNPI